MFARSSKHPKQKILYHNGTSSRICCYDQITFCTVCVVGLISFHTSFDWTEISFAQMNYGVNYMTNLCRTLHSSLTLNSIHFSFDFISMFDITVKTISRILRESFHNFTLKIMVWCLNPGLNHLNCNKQRLQFVTFEL